jgi:hypothetical protein
MVPSSQSVEPPQNPGRFNEMKTADGRYVQALDVDLATAEGKMLQALSSLYEQGIKMPEAQTVLDGLQCMYQKMQDPKVGAA